MRYISEQRRLISPHPEALSIPHAFGGGYILSIGFRVTILPVHSKCGCYAALKYSNAIPQVTFGGKMKFISGYTPAATAICAATLILRRIGMRQSRRVVLRVTSMS